MIKSSRFEDVWWFFFVLWCRNYWSRIFKASTKYVADVWSQSLFDTKTPRMFELIGVASKRSVVVPFPFGLVSPTFVARQPITIQFPVRGRNEFMLQAVRTLPQRNLLTCLSQKGKQPLRQSTAKMSWEYVNVSAHGSSHDAKELGKLWATANMNSAEERNHLRQANNIIQYWHMGIWLALANGQRHPRIHRISGHTGAIAMVNQPVAPPGWTPRGLVGHVFRHQNVTRSLPLVPPCPFSPQVFPDVPWTGRSSYIKCHHVLDSWHWSSIKNAWDVENFRIDSDPFKILWIDSIIFQLDSWWKRSWGKLPSALSSSGISGKTYDIVSLEIRTPERQSPGKTTILYDSMRKSCSSCTSGSLVGRLDGG